MRLGRPVVVVEVDLVSDDDRRGGVDVMLFKRSRGVEGQQ